MNNPQRFHIHTFGCKINQYESQSLRETWMSHGLVEAEGIADADLLVFNSCAVTNRAVADLRRTVRRLHRENPDARVVIAGCAVQVLEAELRESFPDALLVAQDKKDSLHVRIPAMADVSRMDAPETNATDGGDGVAETGHAAARADASEGNAATTAISTLSSATSSDAAPRADNSSDADQGEASETPRPARRNRSPRFQQFAIGGYNRARAVVKVQDGCTHRCTYCIIPDTRGRSVSRPMEDCVDEVRRLFDAGWREITLSGINLRQFGRDLEPEADFWDLLARFERDLSPEWAGRARLRISSVDPGQLNRKALDTLAASTLICPQLHLSLQSLAPAVLKRMGRGHYGPQLVLEWVEGLKEIWPVFGLGADLLVGFPGETDEDFTLTKQNCDKLPLSYAHVFPYSRRPGTPAAQWPDQVPSATSKARAAQLRELAAAKKAVFLARLAERDELAVVVQGDELARGVCEFYAECRFDGPAPADAGRMVRVRPVAVGEGHLIVAAMDDE